MRNKFAFEMKTQQKKRENIREMQRGERETKTACALAHTNTTQIIANLRQRRRWKGDGREMEKR